MYICERTSSSFSFDISVLIFIQSPFFQLLMPAWEAFLRKDEEDFITYTVCRKI